MKTIIISILVVLVLIAGTFMLTQGNNNIKNVEINDLNNVSILDGKQIIEIKAKGGYSPRQSLAKAGIPTILRFETKGTFDCSSAIRIPDLNISKNLPQTGSTEIDIGVQKVGPFHGTCGMGMYPFDIKFE